VTVVAMQRSMETAKVMVMMMLWALEVERWVRH
jgi:hypothetical protein